jgi:hypothetical protein
MTVEKVLEERGGRYGPALDQFVVAQRIKDAMRSNGYWSKLPPQVKETLEMMATKMSRIVTGDPLYDDNWIDIEGYARIVVRDAEEIRLVKLREAKRAYDQSGVTSDV